MQKRNVILFAAALSLGLSFAEIALAQRGPMGPGPGPGQGQRPGPDSYRPQQPMPQSQPQPQYPQQPGPQNGDFRPRPPQNGDFRPAPGMPPMPGPNYRPFPQGPGPQYPQPPQYGGGYQPMPDPRPVPVPPPVPGYPAQGALSCRSYSTKIFGGRIFGYNSCQSCLGSNASCEEVCTETLNVCTVVGINYDGTQRIFTGTGGNQVDAQVEAQRMCDYNRNIRECQYQGCSVSSREFSRVRCQ